MQTVHQRRDVHALLALVFACLSASFVRADSKKPHWAWLPQRSPTPPSVEYSAWLRNGIDAFILAKLEKEGVHPSPEANRSTLIRRVHLDLIGLPPSIATLERWMDSDDPDGYERMVDSLLGSAHFGERQARHWLDQARFADSDGYEKDQPRPHAYHWRDWVISAFNRDLPFDEFTEQQIAGDLLPGANEETRLATGFHRNTLTNREGGIDREEDRVKQVVDRTNTVAQVWMGLTAGCAQCHSHKYDPISHAEYYSLFAFFNSADEQDFDLEPTGPQRAQFEMEVAKHEAALASLRKNLEERTSKLAGEVDAFATNLRNQYPDGVATPSRDGLDSHFPLDASGEGEVQNTVPSRSKGRLHGAVTIGEGRVQQGILLDGRGSHVEFSTDTSFGSADRFSISAWVKLDGEGGGVVTKIDEPKDFLGIDFTIHQRMIEVHLVKTWPRDAIKLTSKPRLAKGKWHHVAFSYDGSKKAKGVRISIDGEGVPTQVHYDQLSGDFANPQPWRIGRRRTTTFFRGNIDDVRIYSRVLSEPEVRVLAGNDDGLARAIAAAAKSKTDRNAADRQVLLGRLLEKDSEAAKLASTLKELEGKMPKIRRGRGSGLAERKESRRTHVHLRGDFLKRGDEVQRATPKFLPTLHVRGTGPDRLDLARWILSDENPLTRRVTVNRIWQQYFGRGLVASSEDFGVQGESPTHPDLLDWLASEFARREYSLKAMHRLVVTSATYRQDSARREDVEERDPKNLWLARQNRLRVEAELVRDLTLSVSGLLDPRIGGR
ncbi:MAG: DUF1549 domain-containing protein, partial [Planctomycetota bacterium]